VTLPEPAASGGRLTWAQARPLSDDLTEELVAAAADGSTPARLELSQVCIDPDGHASARHTVRFRHRLRSRTPSAIRSVVPCAFWDG
jgi:hypothetical protein